MNSFDEPFRGQPATLAQYEPEIGQMCFGQPWQAHPVSDLLDAALEAIRHELGRVLWNLRQRSLDPFGNSGESFRCPTFTVCSYSWNDEKGQPYNFRHPASGLLVSWYKYMGRGMSSNMDVPPEMVAHILTDCLAGARAVESGQHRYDEPGLYPDGALEDEESNGSSLKPLSTEKGMVE